MVDFKRLLTPEQQNRIAQSEEYYEKRLIEFRNMKKENLISTIKYYMTQMHEPYKHEYASPTYDAVFWHLLIPEIIRRLNKEK